MAAPVWVLSVDLQTKTATFQSGMAEAARSARGAFTDIKSGSGEMGREVGGNMMEARHGVMLLGEEFGVHLPRALTTFIASIGPIGAAMEAAFPFLAIAVGATLLIEHLVKMHEAGEKLTQDQVKFGTAVQNAFNSLDQKILQAQIRSDELRNDHLGALHLQLQLIDKQSMAELVKSFEDVAKGADLAFAELKSHWYTFGIGATGAKHALDQFQTQYNSLLVQGKSGEASNLLKGTQDSAEKILAMQKQAAATQNSSSVTNGSTFNGADFVKFDEARNELKKAGVGYSEKEVEAQQALVTSLQAQVQIEGRVSELKKLDSGNAKTSTAKTGASEASTAARQAADSMLRINEQILAGDRATADARLSVQHASIAERLASDIGFADKELQIQLSGNKAQIAALDKMADSYPNQLKALHEKAEEETQQHATRLVELTSKASIESGIRDLQALQQGEREKIDAARQGSAERLSAIDASIKEEQSKHLEETSYYRELLNQRVETVRQAAEEEAKVQAALGKEEADNTEKMGQLSLAAEKQHQEMLDSAHHISIQQRLQEETQAENEEFALKQAANAKETASMDKSAKDYQNKLRENQDKEKQLVQAHENQLTAIKEKAETERNSQILSAEQRFNSEVAQGLTRVLMGHKTFASMMNSLGNQVVSGMIENSIQMLMTMKMTQMHNASAAASAAYTAGVQIGGPFAPVVGAMYGAEAFAAVMAFQSGTDSVPGIGTGDRVPAMLEPGEGVVPGGVMDGLRNMARSGNMGGGSVTHIHVKPTYHLQALDGNGIGTVLDKHSDKLKKHFENAVRKMNR